MRRQSLGIGTRAEINFASRVHSQARRASLDRRERTRERYSDSASFVEQIEAMNFLMILHDFSIVFHTKIPPDVHSDARSCMAAYK